MPDNSLQHIAQHLGQTIKTLREERKLSQESLAEKLDISRTYLAYIETGSKAPSLKVLHKIADILGVTIQDLFA